MSHVRVYEERMPGSTSILERRHRPQHLGRLRPIAHGAVVAVGQRVYDAPVRSVDITPTVLEALRVKYTDAMDGRSLLAAFRGKERPPELPQYSESLLSEVGFGASRSSRASPGRAGWDRRRRRGRPSARTWK
jgi:hypothetical protein